MVLGVVRRIWGEELEMPNIQSYPIETYETGHIYTMLATYRERGIGDATVETADGGLLGVLLPTGEYYAFCPN